MGIVDQDISTLQDLVEIVMEKKGLDEGHARIVVKNLKRIYKTDDAVREYMTTDFDKATEEGSKKRTRRSKEEILASISGAIEGLTEDIPYLENKIVETKKEGKEKIQLANANIKKAKKEITQLESDIATYEALIPQYKKEYEELEASYKADLKAIKAKIIQLQKKKEAMLTPKEPKMTELEKALVDRGLDLKTAKATIRMYKKSGMDESTIKTVLKI